MIFSTFFRFIYQSHNAFYICFFSLVISLNDVSKILPTFSKLYFLFREVCQICIEIMLILDEFSFFRICCHVGHTDHILAVMIIGWYWMVKETWFVWWFAERTMENERKEKRFVVSGILYLISLSGLKIVYFFCVWIYIWILFGKQVGKQGNYSRFNIYHLRLHMR